MHRRGSRTDHCIGTCCITLRVPEHFRVKGGRNWVRTGNCPGNGGRIHSVPEALKCAHKCPDTTPSFGASDTRLLLCPLQEGPEREGPGSSQETEPLAGSAAGEAMEEEGQQQQQQQQQGQQTAGAQQTPAEGLVVLTRGALLLSACRRPSVGTITSYQSCGTSPGRSKPCSHTAYSGRCAKLQDAGSAMTQCL
jgi:hypothetical protein